MLSDEFRLYINENIAFIRRLIIKSEVTAYLINRDLGLQGIPVDENDKSTWKYYLNLSGEYHVTDTVMRVISSDDQTEIDFTKANLALHPLTRVDYDIGGRFYDTLVAQHPEQEYLIHCIVNPIQMADALSADNFTILYHDASFLSSRETNVLAELQRQVYNLDARWDVDDYASIDPYYSAGFLGVFYTQLPMLLVNIRMGNVGTKFVDDFHLWNYLSDHYDLDRYRDVLTDKQALYLYRNMVDIQRNVGKEGTVEKLFEQLGKPSNLDLNKLELQQDNTFQLTNGQTRGTLLYTDFVNERADIQNDGVVNADQVIRDTLDRGNLNELDVDYDTAKLANELNKTTHSKEPIGLYRADPNGSGGVTNADLVDLSINYWIYLAATGFYQAEVDIEIPGRTFIRMTVKDAAIFFIYAANRSNGRETDMIPELWVNDVFTMVAPTFADIRARQVEKYIPDQYITDTIAKLPAFTVLNTTAEFTTLIADLAGVNYELLVGWYNARNDVEVSARKDTVNSLYVSNNYPLVGAPTDFDTWLNAIGFNKYDLSNEDYLLIANDILLKAAGVSITVGALTTRQQAAVEILDMLTSYNVAWSIGAGGADSITIDEIRYLPVEASLGGTIGTFLPHGPRILQESISEVSIVNEIELQGTEQDITVDRSGYLESDLDSGQTIEFGQSSITSRDIYSTGNFLSEIEITHTVL